MKALSESESYLKIEVKEKVIEESTLTRKKANHNKAALAGKST